MPRGRGAISVLAASCTAAVHLLLLAPAMWGDPSPSRPRTPDAYGAGANAGKPGEGEEQRLILIDLHTGLATPENVVEARTLAKLESPPSILHVVGPDSLPVIPLETSTEGEAQEASEADLLARTKLAGLYEGQMRARIERAWRRPREALEAGGFACRVKVRQDARGRVDEVEMERCNGSAAWQQSLVSAINAASPLPAPPNPAVFVDAFSMTFRSQAYMAGGPEEGFQPEALRVVAAMPVSQQPIYPVGNESLPATLSSASRPASSLAQAFVRAEGVVELTGTANQLTWAIREKEKKDAPSRQ